MPKLFAVLLGGRADKCNTELHDVVFVIGNTLEDTYPQLVNKWFGNHTHLHIDTSLELHYVDGYEIILTKEKPSDESKSLYFVNFGGYQKGFFGEFHEVGFYIASSATEAKERGKKLLCHKHFMPHKDDSALVDKLIIDGYAIDDIHKVTMVDQYYVHLKKTDIQEHLELGSFYIRIDTPEIIKQAAHLKIQ